jgi:hypothetical protein
VRLPDFLVIGAGKSGTTSLAAYLDAHPGVFMAHGKELRFFDRYYDRGVDWYAEQFATAGDRRAGEASPTYLVHDKAPALVADVLLRNPVECAYSAWRNAHARELDPRPFADAVEDEMAGRPAANGVDSRYLRSGHYRDLLARWEQADPAAPIHVEWFEDFRDDPRGVFARICTAIGADPSVAPANIGRVYNRSHGFRSERWRQAMLRWRLWDRLPYRAAYWISSLNRVEQEYEPLASNLHQSLDEYFRPRNRDLAEHLGRPLPPGWAGGGRPGPSRA